MQIRCMNCMNLYEDQFGVCPFCGFARKTPPKEVYHLYPEMMLGNRYQIGTVLGFGGFGITYKAWDNQLATMVAIKEYYPAGLVNRTPGTKEVILYTGKGRQQFQMGLVRFLDEAKNMAKFSTHANIVNVFDYFEENGTGYIVMEFLDGISLKEYVKQEGGRIEVDTAVNITLAVMEALKALHSIHILHRDISPDNIFIGNGNRIKLIDFGAARFSTGEQEKTLSIVLKPGYAPPEQYRSKSRQGPWTDIYALGATMYRIVTGVVPEESVNRIVEDQLQSPLELNEQIPPYLDRAIMKAMALSQDLRFQDIKQFQQAIQSQKVVKTTTEELQRRKEIRLVSMGIAALVIVLGVILTYSLYIGKKNEIVLASASITIWLPEHETHLFGALDSAGLQKAGERFREAYHHIEIEIVEIPEQDYTERLLTAAREKQLPTLFYSSGLGEEMEQYYSDVKGVFDTLDGEDYYFLAEAQEDIMALKKVPIGMELPVLYGIPSILSEDYQYSVGDYDQEKFLAKEVPFYPATTREYQLVQESLTGFYQVNQLQNDWAEDGLAGEFTDYFSISAMASKKEKKAAERLLAYFLTEEAQDYIHIQNQGSLPLNKAAFLLYTNYSRELTFLSDMVDELEIMTKTVSQADYREILKALAADEIFKNQYLAGVVKDILENPHGEFLWNIDGLQFDSVEDGILKDKWVFSDGSWYYFDTDGYGARDWFVYKANWYYFDNDTCQMTTGWIQLDDVYYYFDDSGEMLRDTMTPDGYYVDAQGIYSPEIE